ncbi:MAG TPA: alpha/beta hydrolase [Candidatus Saccharimonadales bacterium]
MKRAWLLHGTGGSDTDYYWYADTQKYLQSKGYQVWWPKLPNTEKPRLQETIEYLESDDLNYVFDEQTIIIGHSSACPLILSMLQSFKIPVAQVILVAGFYRPIDDEGFSELMLQKNYNWPAIKQAAKEIILINSDNDPWGCNDVQAKDVALKLGAALVIATGQGHMGSGSFKQPYREFPLLKRLIV